MLVGQALKVIFSPMHNVDCERDVCDCCEIMEEMDRIGPEAVWARLDEFTDRVCESARKLGWTINQTVYGKTVRKVVRQAIKMGVRYARISGNR